jgi:hypothetical protein
MQRGLEQLRLNVAEIGPHFDEHLDQLCDEGGVEGTIYMKGHARWRDNTGNRKDRIPGAARAGLHAQPTKSPLEFDHSHKEITFSHGVNYGIWLETKYHGKFAIIMQAVKAIGESFMAKLEGSLSRVAREQ